MAGYSHIWNTLAARAKAQAINVYMMTGESPTCWLCSNPIDLFLNHRDKWSLTYDHVDPKIDGGPDDPSNMLPAHRSCNTRRSNERKYNPKPEIRNSREW